MNVHFITPPPVERTGGLDAAIDALRAALRTAGTAVDEVLPNATRSEDVVHFHALWEPDHARLSRICLKRNLPYVVSPHGMLEPWAWRQKRWKKWPYFHLVEKRHLQGAAAILATSEMEAQRLRTMLPGTRVEPLPLGLTSDARPNFEHAREKLGWRPDERVLLFLSRLHEKKGVDLLLHALAENSAPRNTRLVIVGGGDAPFVEKIRALAENLAPRLPRVDWIGEVWGEERWKYFQGADLFCLPTHSENFGLAVLEACQVGTPALTTRATPWGGWLGEERGFICDPTVPSVQQALASYFSGGPVTLEARDRLSGWAHGQFSWKALTPRYLSLYRSALQTRRSDR